MHLISREKKENLLTCLSLAKIFLNPFDILKKSFLKITFDSTNLGLKPLSSGVSSCCVILNRLKTRSLTSEIKFYIKRKDSVNFCSLLISHSPLIEKLCICFHSYSIVEHRGCMPKSVDFSRTRPPCRWNSQSPILGCPRVFIQRPRVFQVVFFALNIFFYVTMRVIRHYVNSSNENICRL